MRKNEKTYKEKRKMEGFATLLRKIKQRIRTILIMSEKRGFSRLIRRSKVFYRYLDAEENLPKLTKS